MAEAASALDLTSIEARVLAALLEKQLTTPDVYPLTLKALTNACNQSSNRDPVTAYTEREVEATVLALKAKGLARVVHPGSGERATKYRQVADEALRLEPPERAVVCSLVLRGAQTVAELKARSERLHPFGSAAEVEAALVSLADRSPALAVRLERAPGRKELRWLQLLERDVEQRAAAAAAPGQRAATAPAGTSRVDELATRVEALEARLEALVAALGDLVELDPVTPAAPSPAGGDEGAGGDDRYL